MVYTLPMAGTELGGIKADERTTETLEAKIDPVTGKLYVQTGGTTSIGTDPPTGGNDGDEYVLIE